MMDCKQALTEAKGDMEAAVVVLRSEMIHIPPAGRGPDRVTDFVAGDEEAGRA